MNVSSLLSLDHQQQLAVEATASPLVIQGTYGTGKTLVAKKRWAAAAAQASGPRRVAFVVSSVQLASRMRSELLGETDLSVVLEPVVTTVGQIAMKIVQSEYARLGYTARPRRATIEEVNKAANNERLAQLLPKMERRANYLDQHAELGTAAHQYLSALKQMNLVDRGAVILEALRAVQAGAAATDGKLDTFGSPNFDHFLVDDADELFSPHLELLIACSKPSRLVLTTCRDLRLGTEVNAETIELATVHRYGDDIGRVVSNVDQRDRSCAGIDGSARFISHREGSKRAAAESIRTEALSGTAFSEMAVITFGSVGQAERSLTAAGIEIYEHSKPLATSDFFRLAMCAIRVAGATTDADIRSSDVEMVAVRLLGLNGAEFRDQGRAALLTTDAPYQSRDGRWSPVMQQLLDAIASSETASQQLDAIARLVEDNVRIQHASAISALADLCVAQPKATSIEKLQGLESKSLRTFGRQGVEVTTPQGAVGREWDVVIILDATDLNCPGIVAHRSDFDMFDEAATRDEDVTNLFARAMSHAKRKLLVCDTSGPVSRFVSRAFAARSAELIESSESYESAIGSLRATMRDVDATAAQRTAAALALRELDVESIDYFQLAATVGGALTPSGKLTTSFSRIDKYDDCPLRYAAESVLELDPMTSHDLRFGSLMHLILEKAETGEINTLEEALKQFKQTFQSEHLNDYPNKGYARAYWRGGLDMIKRWWTTERDDPDRETLEIEFSFDSVNIDGHIIRGRIDKISRGPGGLILSDYKSSRNAKPESEIKKSMQLAIYYEAVRQTPALAELGEVDEMEILFLGADTDKTNIPRRFQTPRDAERNLERLRDLLSGAAKEEFAPSMTANCKFCNMKPICPRHSEGTEIKG